MFSDKDRELISISASIASGCEPCTNFHLRAARIAGTNDAEINQAVNEALSVRRHATEGMGQLAALHVGRSTSDMPGGQTSTLISELVSISAAFAVNRVPDLETHIAAARKLGATLGQILSTIKIASATKRMAERKAEDAAARAMGVTPEESKDCGNQMECSHPFGEDVFESSARLDREASSEIRDCGPQCRCHREPKSKHY